MSNKHNKVKSTPSLVDDERRLLALLREHERIGEQIIALVSRTSLETERLLRTLEKEGLARSCSWEL